MDFENFFSVFNNTPLLLETRLSSFSLIPLLPTGADFSSVPTTISDDYFSSEFPLLTNPFSNMDMSSYTLPKWQFSSDTLSELVVELTGSKEFEEAFNKAVLIDPSIQQYKNFLVKTAKVESGFNSHILNRAGAPYYGYFQMGKNEIKETTGLSVSEFRNDPVAQIIGAARLYQRNLNTIKRLGVYELGKLKGFSDDALVAGAWLGGPGGVKTFLLGKGDPSDSHWYGGKGGTSVGKRMRQFNE